MGPWWLSSYRPLSPWRTHPCIAPPHRPARHHCRHMARSPASAGVASGAPAYGPDVRLDQCLIGAHHALWSWIFWARQWTQDKLGPLFITHKIPDSSRTVSGNYLFDFSWLYSLQLFFIYFNKKYQKDKCFYINNFSPNSVFCNLKWQHQILKIHNFPL